MDYGYHLDYIKYPQMQNISWNEIAPILFIMGCFSSIVVFKELFKMVFYNEYDNLEGDIEHLRVSHQNQLNELAERVAQLEAAAHQDTEETVSDSESATTEQTQESQQPQPPPQETQPQETPAQPTVSPAAKNVNHAKVLRHLLNREVYVSYKGRTVAGLIKAKAAAPHGYVVQSEGDEYNTLSNFSFSKKVAVNPNLTSDSGWDSVYVITGTTDKGKPIKKSIRAYVTDLA